MTLIEAAKKALEAMHDHGTSYLNHEDEYSTAIDCLRVAIEQAEKVEPVASAQFHQWAIEEHRKLSAAPITPDPNCTCDEHGACAYCWNGKKHDGYSDGMTAEDDKAFNRQWDVK